MDKKKLVRLIIIIVLTVVLTASAVVLTAVHFHRVNRNVTLPDSTYDTASDSLSLANNPIDFAALKAENADVCGWVSIEGCGVDYAVYQSAEDEEEDYYLSHSSNGKSSSYGEIYIQKINSPDFSDQNTVIYGHNMRNGSMFGSLKKYRDASFFDENEYIYVYTPGHILTYQIYSAFLTDDSHVLYAYDFSEFVDLSLNPKTAVKNIREGVKVTDKDKIITLSTCTSVDTERYLVCGVLTNDTKTK